jgi:Major Facilitator Superfamily
VFASLMVSLIADGVSFSFGLIYSELLDHFEAGPTKTAWVGSLFMSVPLLAGPIMSNLVDKYGCQKMTMIGGIFGCTGFVLSAMSNSIEVLFFTFGIISGLGLGVIYVTAVVSIAFWFESKRTFATGIGASGTGLGTFLYAPFTHWLIESYGWRGATLILGGTLLNFCVFGALMIDPQWLIEENKLEGRSQSIQTFSNSSMCLDEIKKLLETGAPKEDVLDTLVTNFNTEANQQIIDPNIITAKKYASEVLLPTFMSNESDNYDGIRSSSRRSLHPDKLKSPETISRDELLSPLFSKNDSRNEKPKVPRCKIASIETLNPSEKASTNADFDELSLNASLDEDGDCRSLVDSDEGYVTCRRSGMHGSRFSLNETIIAKPSAIDAFKDDLRRSFRGNSLNIVYENETFQPTYQSSPSKSPNGNISDVVIAMPNSFKKMRPNKKFSTTMPAGNLKRNPSLRYSNYLKNMRVHRNSIHYRGAMLNTHRYRLKASSCPNIYRNSMTTIAKENEVRIINLSSKLYSSY